MTLNNEQGRSDIIAYPGPETDTFDTLADGRSAIRFTKLRQKRSGALGHINC